MIILETYTAASGSDVVLPDFLQIDREVTDESEFSMYNLSKRNDREPSPRQRHLSADETGMRSASKPISVGPPKGLVSDVERFNGLTNGFRNGSVS